MRGCDYIARYFREYGLELFFGFQGGAVTPLIDSLVQAGIPFFQNYHEQASGFAAEAYARTRNQLSVALATNGPGATNFVTAIANAYLDSSPCLFITGQVNTFDMRTGGVRQNGFQEVDTVLMCKPITKYAHTVSDSASIRYELDKAIHLATTGRPGSVLLDFPLNILMSEINEEEQQPYPLPAPEASLPVPAQCVWDMLKNAKRPLILVGGGVHSAGAEDLVAQFVQASGIPSIGSLMGADVYTPHQVGFAGLYGQTWANLAAYHADVILTLGCRFAKRLAGKEIRQFTRNAKIIHVDIDEHEIGHVVQADIAYHGHIADIMLPMLALAHPIPCEEWKQQIRSWAQQYADHAHLNPNGVDPVQLIEKISNWAPSSCVITSDVGQNQMWVAQGWTFKKGQRHLTSGGLGCMGFSLPAATGAALAGTHEHIIAFMGDGGMQMNIQELMALSHIDTPITIVVLNNQSLGMIQDAQNRYMGNRYIGTKSGYSTPDLQQLASTYGIDYIKIKNLSYLQHDDVFRSSHTLVEVCLNDNPTQCLIRYDKASLYQ